MRSECVLIRSVWLLAWRATKRVSCRLTRSGTAEILTVVLLSISLTHVDKHTFIYYMCVYIYIYIIRPLPSRELFK